MNANTNNTNVSGKNFWGPAVWKTIHIFCASYNKGKEKELRKFIETLPHLLPCEACREHLKENLKNLRIDNYLDNNHSLFLWSYLLHDIVNKQLGKQSPDYNTIKSIYFKGIGTADCSDCKLN